jgi:hypothetical protein
MSEQPAIDKSKFSDRKPNYFLSMFGLRCPRCRRGPMFKNKLKVSVTKNMAMHQKCPLCGQYNELEVGFYYGTGYVSYALTVALTVATFVAYYVLIGVSINDNSLFIWLGVNVVILVLMMPYLMKLSRTIWLYFFVKYDPEWKLKDAEKPERIVEEQMGNW